VNRAVVTVLFASAAAATAAESTHRIAGAKAHGAIVLAAVGAYFVLKVGILAALSLFMWVRPASRKPSREPVALVACVVAIASVAALAPPSVRGGEGRAIAGIAVAAVASCWLLVAIMTLGRCFGVLPEARGLVTRGPYALVRHPIYLGELTAAGGLVLAAPSLRNLLIMPLFAAAQLVRMRLEEAALAAEFPEYAAYAAGRPRLLPLRVQLTRDRMSRGLPSSSTQPL